jgi:hypothetical protein
MNYSPEEEVLKEEAKVFCKYIVGEPATDQAMQLYVDANSKLQILVTPKERRQINLLMDYKGMLPFADAALAVVNPNGGIRRKLYIMFCITESIPEFSKYFLPKHQSKSRIFYFIYKIIASGMRLLAGLLLLLWI